MGEKSVSVIDGTKKRTWTVARQSRIKIDDDGLRSSLGARAFNTVCKKTVDRSKLEDAIERGKIAAELVAPHIQEALGKPYVVYSEDEISDQ